MREHLERIRKAYDKCVGQYNQGIDPFVSIPAEFRNSSCFTALIEEGKHCNTGNPDIRKYLNPKPGMRFLDAGCGAGLTTYKLYTWPSIYYGVDTSSKTIQAIQSFVKSQGIRIGGLHFSDISRIPFPDDYFDIGALIGVLEYYALPYINLVLKELNRVLKPEAKFTLDIPNQAHPLYPAMVQLEEYLDRPHAPFTRAEFEELLRPYFSVRKVNDSKVMINYYLST
ncbi:class I SAM-dependent methyltransferase [candidate division WOR-3 bacterium]|nr:class I SAM-dependent methyltransferase [candidate division WOR-3 bacterium]